jgi:hypothetical protein
VTTVQIDGTEVAVEIEGNYPWSGDFLVKVRAPKPVRFALRVRIPDWCDDVRFELLGFDQEAEFARGYAVFDKVWSEETLRVEMEMAPRWLEADPRVLDDLGRASLTRGPLVYAFESPDLEGRLPQHFLCDPEAPVTPQEHPFGKALTAEGAFVSPAEVPLYAELSPPALLASSATAIPYFAWANRGPSWMQVWVRTL